MFPPGNEPYSPGHMFWQEVHSSTYRAKSAVVTTAYFAIPVSPTDKEAIYRLRFALRFLCSLRPPRSK
jgi:hypothetical protein